MKLHITENIDKTIDGFTMVPIVYGKIDVDSITNNSAQTIVATDAMDSIPLNMVIQFIDSIKSKMRLGSELIIGGTDLSILSKNLSMGKIDTATYNDIVFSKRGLYSVNDVIEMLKADDKSILIETVTITGYSYEILAKRRN